MKNLLLLPVVALLLLACSGSGLPSEFAQSSELPHIYPD